MGEHASDADRYRAYLEALEILTSDHHRLLSNEWDGIMPTKSALERLRKEWDRQDRDTIYHVPTRSEMDPNTAEKAERRVYHEFERMADSIVFDPASEHPDDGMVWDGEETLPVRDFLKKHAGRFPHVCQGPSMLHHWMASQSDRNARWNRLVTDHR